MKAANQGRKFGFMICFQILLALALVLVLGCASTDRTIPSPRANLVSPTLTDAGLTEGIILLPGVTDADAAYLNESLQFLHDHLPAWWQHIQAAKPFALAIDLRDGPRGRAASTRCCEANSAVITFGSHFDQVFLVSESFARTTAGRRVAFLAVLAHEAMHVRDQKSGRFTVRGDYKTCVEAEHSGLSKQLQFEHDAATVQWSVNLVEEAAFQGQLAQVIATETRAFGSRARWLAYCGHLLGEK